MTGQKQRKFLRSTTSPGDYGKAIDSPPNTSSSGGAGGSGAELRRSTSALARFTRSVSKLGSRRRRGASELPAAILDDEDEFRSGAAGGMNNKLSYETPMRRAETLPTRVSFHDSQSTRNNIGSTGVDAAAFLRAVPDMLGVDASLSNVGAAVKSAENLARTLRASAADVDTSTTAGGTIQAATNSTSAARATESEDALNLLESDRKWDRIHDAFEAALAEHRFEDAFTYWQDLQALTLTTTGERAWILESKCSECAALLVSSLQHEASLLRLAAGGGDGKKELQQQQPILELLRRMVGLPAALASILDTSRARLCENLESLPLKYQHAAATGSGAAAEEASIDLAAALGQTLALGIAATATLVKNLTIESNSSVSNDAEAIVYGALCDWVVAEIAFACEVLRKSVVLPRAAPAGLATTTRCAVAFIVQCDEIDAHVGIAVGQLAREGVWPAVEPVLNRRGRQLCEGIRKAATTETKAATNTTAKLPNTRSGNVSWEEFIAVFPSAKRIATEVSSMASAVAPIAGPAAVANVRSTVTAAFTAFADSIAGVLAAPGISRQKSASIVAEIAMETATRLVEHVLAESTSVLSSAAWGPAVDAAAMVAALDGMAKTLGMDTVID